MRGAGVGVPQAAQGKPGDGARYAAVRAVVPRLEQDRVLGPDIEALAAAVRAGAFNAWAE